MNGAAQSMPSPVSPYSQQPKSSFVGQPQRQRQCYPSSPAMSPQQHQASGQGLGLYPSSMPPSHQSTVSPIMPSPQSEAWSQPSSIENEYPTSQPPDIFSAEFDPFSGFPTVSNTGMVGQHSPGASGHEFSQTSPGSNLQSHRGSISSYASSDGSESAYTPRVKPEDSGEWYPANEHVLQRTQAPMSAYAPNTATLPSQTEDLYRSQPSHAEDLYRPPQSEWSKNDTTGYISELHASSDVRLPRFDMQPIIPSDQRVKKKRQRTTPEEATHECRVCGKLFKRSYNWKSHMETHNPERKYPHPCTAMIGDAPCTKKFQRKTDLDRHHDSVSTSTLQIIDSANKSRFTLKPEITGATFVETALHVVIRSGDIPKTDVRRDSSLVFVIQQLLLPRNLHDGRIFFPGHGRLAWGCHKPLRCPCLQDLQRH